MATLVLITGLPGTGKTTFAKKLASTLGSNLLESDRVRRELFPKRRYTRKENLKVFGTIRKRAEDSLSRGQDVIVDATNLREEERLGFWQLAGRQDSQIVVVRLTAPKSVVQERLSKPRQGESEADFRVYELMEGREEPLTRPCIQVDSRYCTDKSVALTAALCRGDA